MQPSPPDRESQAFVFAIGALALVALILLVSKHQADERREELALERGRRTEAEQEARKSREQLDGALGTISRLKRDDNSDPPAE